MTSASLLSYLSAALSLVALAFFVTGVARTTRLAAQPLGRRELTAGAECDRVQIFADWGCAAGLAGAAVMAFVVSRVDNDPTFNEPTGNVAGGFVLVAVIVLVVLFLTLLFRRVIVSRALRKLKSSD